MCCSLQLLYVYWLRVLLPWKMLLQMLLLMLLMLCCTCRCCGCLCFGCCCRSYVLYSKVSGPQRFKRQIAESHKSSLYHNSCNTVCVFYIERQFNGGSSAIFIISKKINNLPDQHNLRQEKKLFINFFYTIIKGETAKSARKKPLKMLYDLPVNSYSKLQCSLYKYHEISNAKHYYSMAKQTPNLLQIPNWTLQICAKIAVCLQIAKFCNIRHM